MLTTTFRSAALATLDANAKANGKANANRLPAANRAGLLARRSGRPRWIVNTVVGALGCLVTK
jgi:hypothetical protein